MESPSSTARSSPPPSRATLLSDVLRRAQTVHLNVIRLKAHDKHLHLSTPEHPRSPPPAAARSSDTRSTAAAHSGSSSEARHFARSADQIAAANRLARHRLLTLAQQNSLRRERLALATRHQSKRDELPHEGSKGARPVPTPHANAPPPPHSHRNRASVTVC